MCPLSTPAAATSQAALSVLAERSLFVDSGGSNTDAATNWGWAFIGEWNGQSSMCSASNNRVARISDLRGKATPFAGQPDVGAGFTVGQVFEAVQAPDGTLYCFLSSAPELGVSVDDGVTWTPLVRPALAGSLASINVTANNRFWVGSTSLGGPNLAFSDNRGATWTEITVAGIGGAGFGRLVTPRDGSRILYINPNIAQFSSTTEIDGSPPPFTFVDLQVLLGIAVGAGGNEGTRFDIEGGCFFSGNRGNFVYTANFVDFTLIPDAVNPMVRGDSVSAGGAFTTSCAYSSFYDGFVCVENTFFGGAAFFPRESITEPKNILLVGTATTGSGTADDDGNILFHTNGSNQCYTNLTSDFGAL